MIRPTLDRVLIQVDEEAETSAGGIHIPNSARASDSIKHATVIATGPGGRSSATETSMGVKAGDRVLVGRLYSHELSKTWAAPRQYIIQEEEILAVLDDACGNNVPVS